MTNLENTIPELQEILEMVNALPEAGGGNGGQTINGKRFVFGKFTSTEDTNTIILMTYDEASELFNGEFPSQSMNLYWREAGYDISIPGALHFAGMKDPSSTYSIINGKGSIYYIATSGTLTRSGVESALYINPSGFIVKAHTSGIFKAGLTYCWMIIEL